MAFGGVFNGKRVLVTGHAGFKGSWLSLWLNALGAKVCGYSLLPDTEFSAYREAGVGEILECEKIADIRDSEELESFFRKARPEIVFHLAAQPREQFVRRTPHPGVDGVDITGYEQSYFHVRRFSMLSRMPQR